MRIPVIALLCLACAALCWPQARQTVVLRGQQQTLYVYGSPSGDPVIISSGDGGWIHLAPAIAEFLAGRGFSAIGFDARAYLSSFTTSRSTLRVEDEPGDFKALVQRARGQSTKKPILIGVSEGAGLSALAAADPALKSQIAGVIALGMPEQTELGWRFRDSIIYFTHKTPNEPTFSTAGILGEIAPLPFAAIHSTGDEFIPLAQAQKLFASAHDPKRLWVVNASDHRFSDNLEEFERRLLEAIAWIRQNDRR